MVNLVIFPSKLEKKATKLVKNYKKATTLGTL